MALTISILALVISLWSAWGVYQNTQAIKHIIDALDDIKIGV